MARIIILGAGGRLGAALLREFAADHQVSGFNRAQLDLGDGGQLRETLGALEFDLLVNCAAQTNVDRCEAEPAEAFALNAEAPGLLAEICATQGARLIHISTDYIFEGAKTEPYTEEDEARPISVYGESKLEGERRVLAVSGDHLVARVAWVFGPDRASFVDWIIQQAREKEEVAAVADKFSTPTYTHDIAEMLRRLVVAGVADPGCASDVAPAAGVGHPGYHGGIIHLTSRGSCTWQEYGQWALDCCLAKGMELRAERVGAISLADMKQFVARRPVYTVLSTEKYERLTGQKPRTWQDAVRAYVRDHVAPTRAR
ncbi:MAG: dTDP-4-dehydrorhamnose reductase [Chthoniobacterales bacterium]